MQYLTDSVEALLNLFINYRLYAALIVREGVSMTTAVFNCLCGLTVPDSLLTCEMSASFDSSTWNTTIIVVAPGMLLVAHRSGYRGPRYKVGAILPITFAPILRPECPTAIKCIKWDDSTLLMLVH
ncbi:hypothetical protein MSG28_010844 [Choristoneura fumiferana]|uniref:Uncharacterized protein n=1 Tax=Choristoneura fumiferana TaxID=7141 RepID=A0ACC0KNS8_CHOFU|nr:hypothetical protein MSG28_010844 [Choristoneura fumiferana]